MSLVQEAQARNNIRTKPKHKNDTLSGDSSLYNRDGKNDLFAALYGNEKDFTPNSKQGYFPSFANYEITGIKPPAQINEPQYHISFRKDIYAYQDDPSVSSSQPSQDLAELPANNLSKQYQSVPKLVIPRNKPHQYPATTRQQPLAPLRCQVMTPSTTPRANNDHLFFFDENDYDSPEFTNSILEKLAIEPIKAKSLYTNEDNTKEWKDCLVIEFIDPQFKIQWADSDKWKLVNRIALQFEDDDQERFTARRIKAMQNRRLMDQQLRREAYLYARSLKNHIQPQPEFVSQCLKKLEPELATSPKLPTIIQDVESLFSYAYALERFVNEWKDEAAAAKFLCNGLEYFQFPEPCLINPNKLENSIISTLEVSYFETIANIVKAIDEFSSDQFLETTFKLFHPPLQFSCFFEQLIFDLESKISAGKSLLRRSLCEMISGIEDETIIQMINLRFKDAMSNILYYFFTNFIDYIDKFQIKFDVVVNSDLTTFNYSFDYVRECAIKYFNQINEVYETNKVYAVNKTAQYEVKLILPYWYANIALKKNEDKWQELILAQQKEYEEIKANILQITDPIPEDPEKIVDELFDAKFEELDFEKIRRTVQNAKNAIDEYVITFSDRIKTLLFVIDNREYDVLIKSRYHELYEYVFSRMSKLTDDQLNTLDHMVSTIEQGSGKTPNSIEDWYEKHLILLHIRDNIETLDSDLGYVITVFEFMSDFLYEPKRSFADAYDIKFRLHNLANSISSYMEQDEKEREHFIVVHSQSKKELTEELGQFQAKLLEFHFLPVSDKIIETNDLLSIMKEQYDSLCGRVNLYKERDQELRIEVSNYPIQAEIEKDFSIFLPLLYIGTALETEARTWLSTQFRLLDVQKITETLIEWRKRINDIKDILTNDERYQNVVPGQVHPLVPHVGVFLKETENLILHLPIITSLCNSHFRARHWYQVGQVINMDFDPNEGITWNWLIESGIEKSMLTIAAIARSAEMEYKIESSLSDMILDLQSMHLKVYEQNGVVRLADPTYVVVMLGNHMQRMQEIFIPPFVQPFLSKIRDYDVLAANLRKILKQTLDAQQQIDELKPAMDSHDIRTQHEEIAQSFDTQVEKFNEFTSSFQLSLSFQQVVSNQRYVDITKDLSSKLSEIREDFGEVLERKRVLCPRFRLLSDIQLISIISNCNKPSTTKELFSLMFLSIKEAIIENEKICTGFVSESGEKFIFDEPINVTPNAIEVWHLQFEKQIQITMNNMCQRLQKQSISNISKLTASYPIQVILLVLEIGFTNNVQRCFEMLETSFADNKAFTFQEQLKIVLNSINQDLEVFINNVKSSHNNQISSMIILYLNHRDTIEELINNQIDSANSAPWYSKIKYFLNNDDDDYIVNVQIGPNIQEYGFEFTGIQRPFIQTHETDRLFNSLMIAMNGQITPMLCACVEAHKTTSIQAFAHALGKQPFVFPCTASSSLVRIKTMISNAILCNTFIILKDIGELESDIFQEISLFLMTKQKELPHSVSIFATYSYDEQTTQIPDSIKFAYRPIALLQTDLEVLYKRVLLSLGLNNVDRLSKNLFNMSTILYDSFMQPFCSVLNETYLFQVLGKTKFDTETPPEDSFYDQYIQDILTILHNHDTTTLIQSIDALFGKKTIRENTNSTQYEDLLFAIRSQFAVLIFGAPLCGKTSLIKKAANEMNTRLEYVNPYSIDLNILFGEKDPGLLSSILQESEENTWIVFDGQCTSEWMNSINSALSGNHLLYFGDGSKMMIPSSFRFLFETDDITSASPATLSQCSTFYLDDNYITVPESINFFINTLTTDKKLVEQLSNTIVGSTIPASELANSISKFSNYFIPKLVDLLAGLPHQTPVTSNHLMNYYFMLLRASIQNYYLVDTSTLVAKHQAEDLIKDLPNLMLFALFWSFGGGYVDDLRTQIDHSIIEFINESDFKEVFSLPSDEIEMIFFDELVHEWKRWEDISTSTQFALDVKMNEFFIDLSPEYLFVVQNTLISTLFISSTMLTQSHNVLIYGPKSVNKSTFLDLAMHIPYIQKNMSLNTFSLPNDSTHQIIRQIVHMLLPDPHVAQGFTLRSPLLSLNNFGASCDSTLAEFVRYMIEHDYFQSDKTYAKEIVSGIRFFLGCDECQLNQSLAHHTFLINLPMPSQENRSKAISVAINMLWGIKQNTMEIASSLLMMLKDLKTSYKFDLNHLLLVMQRVAIVQQSQTPDMLLNSLVHETVRVFYDAHHSEDILAKINLSMRSISKVFKGQVPNAFDIGHKMILTNFNSSGYRVVNTFDDLNSESEDEETQQSLSSTSNIKYTKSDIFKNLGQDKLSKIHKYSSDKQFDIIALTRAISVPRNHVLIITDLPQYGFFLMEESTELIGGELHLKEEDKTLLSSFHDAYVQAGLKQENQILFIEYDSLVNSEKTLLKSLTHNPNVFGLFKQGEILHLMTDLHSKGSNFNNDSFNEETLESQANYNELVTDFMTNCSTYFHFCIVCHKESDITNVEIFSPFVSIELAIKDFVEEPELFEIIRNLRQIPILARFPFLVSYQNMYNMYNSYKRHREIHLKTIGIKNEQFNQVNTIMNGLESFLRENLLKMQRMEEDLVKVNEQIDQSMIEIEKLKLIAEEETKKFQKEAEIMKIEEEKADKLRKECEAQLKETKQILASATKEVKALSSRDIAVIKTMNHPPTGVVLVVKAICIIMGNEIDLKRSDEIVWKTGRVVMNDPSFLSKLIAKALDDLPQKSLDQIKQICSDENFEPTQIERSSTAAKSICIFIRSVVPYYNALAVYKERNNTYIDSQIHLRELQQRHGAAMESLAHSKKDLIDTQRRQETLLQSKQSSEMALENQKEKISNFNKVVGQVHDYYQRVEANNPHENKLLFLQACYRSLCGPFSNSERNELIETLATLFGFTDEENIREKLLNTNDPLVNKWHKFQYPVSLFMKENASLLSPQSYRWVIVEGLRYCSTSFIKRLLDKQCISYLSTLSPTFEGDLVQAIVHHNGIIIFDFDFSAPSTIITNIRHALISKTPLFFNGEAIAIPENLNIYFDVDDLPSHSWLEFDGTLVHMRINSNLEIEQLSLKLFDVVQSQQSSDAQRIENQIRATEEQIEKEHADIRELLKQSTVNIFVSRNDQVEFNARIMRLNESEALLAKLIEQHAELLGCFKQINVIAQEFVNSCGQTHVLKLFDDLIVSTFSVDDQKKLKSMIAASLDNEENEIIEPSKLILSSSPRIPLICISDKSMFLYSALLETCHDKLKLVDPHDLNNEINHCLSEGKILITSCESHNSLLLTLSSISNVLAQSFVNENFRLIILLNDLFKLPTLTSRCTHVRYVGTPSFNTIYSATLNSLTQTKFDENINKLALFHAYSSLERFSRHFSRIYPFSSFKLSLQFAHLSPEDFYSYVSTYVYSSMIINEDSRILETWRKLPDLQTPVAFTRQAIENAVSTFPHITFSQFHLDTKNEETTEEKDVSQLMAVSINPRLQKEFNIAQIHMKKISRKGMKLTPIFQRRLSQLLASPDVVDLSLFVQPHVFFETILADYSREKGVNFDDLILIIEDESNPEIYSTSVTGLIISNATYNYGFFTKSEGFEILPKVKISPRKKSNDYHRVRFYHNGINSYYLYIVFHGDANDISNIDVITINQE